MVEPGLYVFPLIDITVVKYILVYKKLLLILISIGIPEDLDLFIIVG